MPVLVAGLLGACSEGKAQGNTKPALKVAYVVAEAPPLRTEVQLYGEVRTERRSVVGAEVAGRVKRIQHREGQSVREDAVIASLDTQLAKQELARLKAQVQATSAEEQVAGEQYKRFLAVGEEAAAASERDEARARTEQAKANLAGLSAELRAAEIRLRKHQVRAPFAGEIAKLLVEEGAWVSEGTSVAELSADSEAEVWAFGDPSLVDSIAKEELGAEAASQTAAVGTYKGKSVPLRLLEKVNSVTAQGSTQLLRFRIEGGERPVLGSSIPITLSRELGAGDERNTSVVVPRDALMKTPVGTWFLFEVVDDKAQGEEKAQRRSVTLIAENATHALVEGDKLRKGAKVVVRGNERLTPGAVIRAEAHKAKQAGGASKTQRSGTQTSGTKVL